MELENIINNVEDQAEKQNVEEKNSIHREADHLKDRQPRSYRKKDPHKIEQKEYRGTKKHSPVLENDLNLST